MGKMIEEEDEMSQVFYCGKDSRSATRIIGRMQVVISGILFLFGVVTLAILLSLEKPEIKKLEVWGQHTLLPCGFVYDGVLIFCFHLTFNFLAAFVCGFILIEGAEKRQKHLLFTWTLYIIITFFGNLILICTFSLLLAQAFGLVYLTLCIIPYKVVQTLHEDILFYEKLRAHFESKIGRSADSGRVVQENKPFKDVDTLLSANSVVVSVEP